MKRSRGIGENTDLAVLGCEGHGQRDLVVVNCAVEGWLRRVQVGGGVSIATALGAILTSIYVLGKGLLVVMSSLA